jgi:hypothetical protein
MTDIQERIEALLDLARAEAASAKSTIADDLSEIIYVDGAPFSPRELDIATDILRKLVRETEIAVRQRLSERLARDPRAPRDLVLALANDNIMVARPVLTMSAALRDKDLIEIIRQKTRQHQLAVAARDGVAEPVTAALAESGSADVVTELLKNPSARIAETTYAYIAEARRKKRSCRRRCSTARTCPATSPRACTAGWRASSRLSSRPSTGPHRRSSMRRCSTAWKRWRPSTAPRSRGTRARRRWPMRSRPSGSTTRRYSSAC